MTKLELTKTELFKSFAEIEIDDIYVDLHNEFDCYEINFSKNSTQLILLFKASKNNARKIKHVKIIFNNIDIDSINLKIKKNHDSNWTVSTIYRGRFVDHGNVLSEVSSAGKYYYYLDFYDDYSFEIFSDSVIAELT